MARLNDPPQPTGETVESLKRRFVRQNRELARVNSTQSIRIRNLEAEVSRLLGENVSLREQVIRLHYEVENRPSDSGWEKVEGLKEKLETRLIDLGALLRELGNVQQKAAKEKPGRRKSQSHSPPKRSPPQGQWRNTQTLSVVTGEVDGRLPPIIEDEARGRFSEPGDLTDSPDLGPPPIAHFEEGDPIKFDSGPLRLETSLGRGSSIELSANLETRKKRRESLHQRDSSIKKDSTQAENKDRPRDGLSQQSLKAGPKRKLLVRDDEEDQPDRSETDGFKFNRKTMDEDADCLQSAAKTGLDKKSSVEVRGSRTEKPTGLATETNARSSTCRRKALGPKSVNTDPQSPAKLASSSLKEKPIEISENPVKPLKQRNPARDRGPTGIVRKSNKEAVVTKKQDTVPLHAPKTPIPEGLDLFSPTISDPSEPRPERGDTPPPPDLGPDSGTGSFGRASRRSRDAVSYAEPNLRDKMRRPTKELVDAVGADRARQIMNGESEGSVSSLEEGLSRLKIKQGAGDEVQPVWKTKPMQESKSQQERQRAVTTSPLGSKEATLPAADLPASVTVTDRRRRASSVSRQEEQGERKVGSGAAIAIAALAGHKNQARLHSDGSSAATHEASDRTSIFDFTSSSPENVDKDSEEGPVKPLRVSRRHSNVPATGCLGRGSIVIARRKCETPVDKDAKGDVVEGPGLRSSSSTANLDAADGGSTGRAASRRRSMMI